MLNRSNTSPAAKFLYALLTCSALLACREDSLIPDANLEPTADARAIGTGGKAIDEDVDGGPAMLQFELEGDSIEVTLDGSNSKDEDGSIATYRWLSGTAVPADAGVADEDGGVESSTTAFSGRIVPKGEDAQWPADVRQPKVKLTEGIWTFTLWVIDDEGSISAPDTIQIIVGALVDPAIAECEAQVIDAVPEACRMCICARGEACRAAVVESACDDVCWSLITCVATLCPDFAEMAAQNPPDYSCVNSMCTAYLSAVTAAGAAGDCAVQCPTECGP